MVKKDRFRLSIVALVLFVLPFVAACGGTTETPAAESSPAPRKNRGLPRHPPHKRRGLPKLPLRLCKTSP